MKNILLDYQQLMLEYAQDFAIQELKNKGRYIDEENKKYVIYARKSTKSKKRQEKSIEDQIQECRQLAERDNLKILGIFREEESARRSDKRDYFKEMIKNIKNGKYNSIIAWHPDRLARNMREAGEVLDMLSKGLIVDLKFPSYIFTRDATGMMALGLQFVLAANYSDNLSLGVSRGYKRRAMEGILPLPKRGYTTDEKGRPIPDEPNFELLRKGVEKVLSGQNLRDVSHWINNNGYVGRKGPPNMNHQVLSQILKDPMYTGYYTKNGEVINLNEVGINFKPLLSSEEFLKIRASLDKSRGYRKYNPPEVLLKRMVKCAYCGNIMPAYKPEGGSGKRYLRIRCTNEACERVFDKNLKTDYRSKLVFDFVYELLDQGLKVTKKGYDEYVKSASLDLHKEKENIQREHKTIPSELRSLQREIDTKSDALAKATSSVVQEEFNKELDIMFEKKSKLESDLKNVTNKLIAINQGVGTNVLSYEKFVNFFETLSLRLRKSENRYEVDKILRMVFVNFTVRDGEVVDYQLNPDFRKYVKTPFVKKDRSDRTRYELFSKVLQFVSELQNRWKFLTYYSDVNFNL